jgi:hypothetical protein
VSAIPGLRACQQMSQFCAPRAGRATLSSRQKRTWAGCRSDGEDRGGTYPPGSSCWPWTVELAMATPRELRHPGTARCGLPSPQRTDGATV